MAAWLMNLGFAASPVGAVEEVEDSPSGGILYERPTGQRRRDDDLDLFTTIHAFIQVINKL